MRLLLIQFPDFDPVLVQIGPFAIRWYALAYIFGILIGWAYARLLIRSTKLWGRKAPMTVIDFDDFVLWVTIGIILGGRIGYVLFYNLPYFVEHPIEIVQLWNGGMSFHGGFIGCVLAVLLFGYTRGISVLSLGDLTCAAGTIGLFLGRIANFINGELWGRPTDVPWAMIFPNGGPLPRHPSQLYEAGLEGLLLFIVLGFGFSGYLLPWNELAFFATRVGTDMAGIFITGRNGNGTVSVGNSTDLTLSSTTSTGDLTVGEGGYTGTMNWNHGSRCAQPSNSHMGSTNVWALMGNSHDPKAPDAVSDNVIQVVWTNSPAFPKYP
jgi:phosphatidylglycerol:prolipoprotein diacylglycerol transferase